MGRNSHPIQLVENVFRDAVVQHAFPVDHLVLLGVEGGRVILEVLDERPRFRPFVKDLGLALVNSAAAVHGSHRSDMWIGVPRSASRGIAGSDAWCGAEPSGKGSLTQ